MRFVVSATFAICENQRPLHCEMQPRPLDRPHARNALVGSCSSHAFRERLIAVLAVVFSSAACAADSGSAQAVFASVKDQVVQVRLIDQAGNAKTALGSGFVVSDDGRIISNYHVVSGLVNHPERFRAEYLDQKGQTGKLELLDIDVVHDLALLRAGGFPAAHFDIRSELPAMGERLYSMGNPVRPRPDHRRRQLQRPAAEIAVRAHPLHRIDQSRHERRSGAGHRRPRDWRERGQRGQSGEFPGARKIRIAAHRARARQAARRGAVRCHHHRAAHGQSAALHCRPDGERFRAHRSRRVFGAGRAGRLHQLLGPHRTRAAPALSQRFVSLLDGRKPVPVRFAEFRLDQLFAHAVFGRRRNLVIALFPSDGPRRRA